MERGPYHSSARTRGRIRAALADAPDGLTRSEIARRAGLSWNAVAHHALRMAARGELEAQGAGRSVRFRLARRS